MQYSEHSFEFAGTADAEGWTIEPLLDDCGTILSLIMSAHLGSLTTEAADVEAPRWAHNPQYRTRRGLQLWIATRMDRGGDWLGVRAIGGSLVHILVPGEHLALRLYGPFGKKLGLAIAIARQAVMRNAVHDQVQIPGEYRELTVTIGVQRA